jgi:hypothetical protein
MTVMVTSAPHPAITCPSWCNFHEDMNRPRPEGTAGKSDYDETVNGGFLHHSATQTAGGVDVWRTAYTDWSGHHLEPPAFSVDGHLLTGPQARELLAWLRWNSNDYRRRTELKWIELQP